MKKVIAGIVICALGLIFMGYTNTYALNNQEIGGMFINSIKSENQNKTIDNQIKKFDEMIFNINSISDFITDPEIQGLLAYLLVELEEEKLLLQDSIQVPNTSSGDENIDNVDWNIVRNTILSWHNEVRRNSGLHNYILEDELNQTANIWADHLVNIGTATHKRLSSDGYYNYNSIKDWFNNQGVYFEGNGTQFTESIGYRSFSCTKSDCTQELLNTIKKSFDFFMSEKSYNGPHYRAIMHPSFKYMGIGFDTNGKNSFVVIHYGNKVK